MFSQFLKIGVVAAICVGHVSAGFPYISSRKASAVAIPSPEPPQIQASVSFTDSMMKIQDIISNVQSMPTCEKTAAKDLIHSCESFKDLRNGQNSGDVQLQAFQKLFAIRMTNCEQSHRDHPMPNACRPLLVPDLTSMPKQQAIDDCIVAMDSKTDTNQWITYSRVVTDGMLMCHSMRVAADKDDLIHLHKILFGAVADINGAILMQKDELEALMTSAGEITRQMQDFRDALHDDNQQIKNQLKGFSEELKGSMADINEASTPTSDLLDPG